MSRFKMFIYIFQKQEKNTENLIENSKICSERI